MNEVTRTHIQTHACTSNSNLISIERAADAVKNENSYKSLIEIIFWLSFVLCIRFSHGRITAKPYCSIVWYKMQRSERLVVQVKRKIIFLSHFPCSAVVRLFGAFDQNHTLLAMENFDGVSTEFSTDDCLDCC